MRNANANECFLYVSVWSVLDAGSNLLPPLPEVRDRQEVVKARAAKSTPLSFSDPKWMRWMVATIIAVDTLNSAVSSYVAYDYSVSDFGK